MEDNHYTEENDYWKRVEGFERLYAIGRGGEVWSFRAKRNLNTERIGEPYRSALLRDGEKTRKGYVHRLLAEAFLPNPDNLPVVRHLNDDKRDNRLENLAWGEQQDNVNDMIKNSGHPNSNKTHCIRGHELAGDNLYIAPEGGRVCRKCRQMRVDEFTKRRAGQEPPEHGTWYAHGVFKCRCDLCRKVKADYDREYLERKKQTPKW